MVPGAHLHTVTCVGAREFVLEARDGIEVGLLTLGVARTTAAAIEALLRGRGGSRGGAGVGDGGLEGRGYTLRRGGRRCAEVVAGAAAAGVNPGGLGDGRVWLSDGVVGHVSLYVGRRVDVRVYSWYQVGESLSMRDICKCRERREERSVAFDRLQELDCSVTWYPSVLCSCVGVLGREVSEKEGEDLYVEIHRYID